jgi:hypothetical protein
LYRAGTMGASGKLFVAEHLFIIKNLAQSSRLFLMFVFINRHFNTSFSHSVLSYLSLELYQK